MQKSPPPEDWVTDSDSPKQWGGCNINKNHSKPFKTGSVITPISPMRTLRLGLGRGAICHYPKEDYANTERIR